MQVHNSPKIVTHVNSAAKAYGMLAFIGKALSTRVMDAMLQLYLKYCAVLAAHQARKVAEMFCMDVNGTSGLVMKDWISFFFSGA